MANKFEVYWIHNKKENIINPFSEYVLSKSKEDIIEEVRKGQVVVFPKEERSKFLSIPKIRELYDDYKAHPEVANQKEVVEEPGAINSSKEQANLMEKLDLLAERMGDLENLLAEKTRNSEPLQLFQKLEEKLEKIESKLENDNNSLIKLLETPNILIRIYDLVNGDNAKKQLRELLLVQINQEKLAIADLDDWIKNLKNTSPYNAIPNLDVILERAVAEIGTEILESCKTIKDYETFLRLCHDSELIVRAKNQLLLCCNSNHEIAFHLTKFGGMTIKDLDLEVRQKIVNEINDKVSKAESVDLEVVKTIIGIVDESRSAEVILLSSQFAKITKREILGTNIPPNEENILKNRLIKFLNDFKKS